jgi:hypothetical protein
MIFPHLMTCQLFSPDAPVLPRHKAHFFAKTEACHKAEFKKKSKGTFDARHTAQ